MSVKNLEVEKDSLDTESKICKPSRDTKLIGRRDSYLLLFEAGAVAAFTPEWYGFMLPNPWN